MKHNINMIGFKYYEENGLLHIQKHSVSAEEVEEILLNKKFYLELQWSDGCFIANGKTLSSERYLEIVYRKECKNRDTIFYIITAYDIKSQIAINIINRLIEC